MKNKDIRKLSPPVFKGTALAVFGELGGCNVCDFLKLCRKVLRRAVIEFFVNIVDAIKVECQKLLGFFYTQDIEVFDRRRAYRFFEQRADVLFGIVEFGGEHVEG